MKRMAWIALACGVGTLAALQLDGWLDRRSAGQALLVASVDAPVVPVVPVQRGAIPALPDFRAAAQRINSSVVSVDTLVRSRWFTEQIQAVGSGSGVVISADGYIVTNDHVLRGGGGRLADVVRVNLVDGRSLEARVVGADPRSDLAVLKVDAERLTPAVLGSSARLRVGEWVIAAGNPLGYEHSVSVGVVSSLGRTLPTEGSVLIDAIQTDAAINQGNSGGALANSQGELVGINTAIASAGGGSIGIGFAIPVDRMKRVVDDLIRLGRVPYGVLGLSIDKRAGLLGVPRARQELAEIAGAEPPTRGLLVSRVLRGSPAEAAGMRSFSVLLSIDGKRMDDPIAFVRALADKRVGESVTVEFWQAGRTITRTVRLIDL